MCSFTTDNNSTTYKKEILKQIISIVCVLVVVVVAVVAVGYHYYHYYYHYDYLPVIIISIITTIIIIMVCPVLVPPYLVGGEIGRLDLPAAWHVLDELRPRQLLYYGQFS